MSNKVILRCRQSLGGRMLMQLQRSILHASIISFLIVPVVHAQTEMELELQNLQDEIDLQSKDLAEISRRETQTREEQKVTEVAIKKLRLEREALDAEIKLLEQQATKGALEVDRLAREIERHEAFSSARMRAVYMNGGFAPSQVLASAHTLDAAALTGFYLSRVREADMRRVEMLSRLKQDHAYSMEKLDRIASDQASKRIQVQAKEEAQRKALNRLKEIVNQLAKEKAALQHSVLALKARSLRLETMVTSVTEGALVSTPHDSSSRSSQETDPVAEQFEGVGLSEDKGRLPPPVLGQVTRGFGKYQPSDAREILLHKGLEYAVQKGSEVRSVAAGRVMFVGKMPAYGGLIILDHGERYYSLYGYLHDVKVEVGAKIPGRATLATTDDTGRFYFEIRKNGTPINPVQYLAKVER